MNVEQRLLTAAEETRQLARRRLPRSLPVEPAGVHRRGWLAFAAAFVVVVATFGLVPWLARNTDVPPTGDDFTPLTAPASPTTWPPTTIGTAPQPECSSAGVAAPDAATGLPGPVATTRDLVVAAASECDLSALQDIAGDTFTTSFGGGGAENLGIWEEEGRGRLGILLQLLDMSHGEIRGDEGIIYVWPAAFAYQSWDEIPHDAVAELAAIHSEGDLDEFATLGSYVGWRTGIDSDGNWLFFVAGD